MESNTRDSHSDFYYTINNDHTETYYHLKQVNTFTAPGFVLCPYTNPLKRNLAPRYFSIAGSATSPVTDHGATEPPRLELTALTSKAQYLKTVAGLKDHIQRGDIYEINYCIRFEALIQSPINIFTIFSRLRAIADAPYAGLLKIGDDYILCASPELFLSKKGNLLFTKPIKGTRKRGLSKEDDRQLKNELFHSLKERTENVMAVDVSRNDLSMLAEKGSVKVNALYNIETFKNVHQMVSTVSCELKPNTHFETILQATFPMASMTGAPKKRAMQLIDENENFERGYYSGTMGLIDEEGNFEMPVIIRSILYNAKTQSVNISVGSAITYLSDAEQEYEECILKARNMLRALNAEIIS